MEERQISKDLKGSRVLVTGGTKGIGKAIADELAEAGARVIITARNAPAAAASTHHFVAADLTKTDDVVKLEKEIKEQFGGIDILINNVGGLTTPGGGFSTLTDAHWSGELELNLIAATRLDRILLPGMIEQGKGVIIHISSVAGKQPLWKHNLAYAVSKAALNSYSKALATELASQGVRVLTVSPGATKTELMENFISDFATASGIPREEGFQRLLGEIGGIPMGRMAEPTEVASLVHFLVSPNAAYLTGSIFAIDGGSLPVI